MPDRAAGNTLPPPPEIAAIREGRAVGEWLAGVGGAPDDVIAAQERVLAALERVSAERDEARAILHPGDEAALGKLIAALRAQIQLDEGGYCVLCGMHYTDEETLAFDRDRGDKAERRAEAAEAERDRLREALERIADPTVPSRSDQGDWRLPYEVARAALAGGTDAAPTTKESAEARSAASASASDETTADEVDHSVRDSQPFTDVAPPEQKP